MSDPILVALKALDTELKMVRGGDYHVRAWVGGTPMRSGSVGVSGTVLREAAWRSGGLAVGMRPTVAVRARLERIVDGYALMWKPSALVARYTDGAGVLLTEGVDRLQRFIRHGT